MTIATPTRLGQINNATGSYAADNAIFLKVFGGEVMAAFQELNVMSDKQMVRSISSGKSASFPAVGKATASYHTPGNELNGSNQIPLAERIINIDDLLVADMFLSNIEEAKLHFDVRSTLSGELGRALAYALDKKSLQQTVLAARSANTVTGIQGGTALVNANYGTIGSTLAAGIFQANQTFDEKDIPEDERYFYCRPAQYYLLAQTTEVLNRDWGGSGAYSEGKVLKVAGISIVKGNHLPITNISAITGEQNTYNGNFTTTVGVAWHKSCTGTVKLLDLAMEMEYEAWRQGTLLLAKYALGTGILRPEAAVELKTA